MLKDNDIEMYSIHNKGKSVVAERFIRRLKNNIFKHMTALSKNVYFDVLDDILNKCNKTIHSWKWNLLILKIIIRILIQRKKLMIKIENLKYGIMLGFLSRKIFLQKDTHQIDLKKFLLLVRLKKKFHGHMLFMLLMVKKLQKHFMKKNCRRLIK